MRDGLNILIPKVCLYVCVCVRACVYVCTLPYCNAVSNLVHMYDQLSILFGLEMTDSACHSKSEQKCYNYRVIACCNITFAARIPSPVYVTHLFIVGPVNNLSCCVHSWLGVLATWEHLLPSTRTFQRWATHTFSESHFPG